MNLQKEIEELRQACESQHQEERQGKMISENDQIRTMIELLDKGAEGKVSTPSGAKLPQNDAELLTFLDTAVLEDLPTELLVKLAH